MKELMSIQKSLKAPKNQYNRFGGYAYRSAEDILEAVKPLLAKEGCTLTITDDIVMVGSRIYVQATATLKNANGETEETTAYAREPETKKGSDESQITGAASSYARKYALNGLFCIDDNKDSDVTNTHGANVAMTSQQTGQTQQTGQGAQQTGQAQQPAAKPVTLETIKGWITKAQKESDLMAIYKRVPADLMEQVKPLLTARKKELKGGAA